MYVVLLGLVKVFDEMPHQAFKRGSIVLVKVYVVLLGANTSSLLSHE